MKKFTKKEITWMNRFEKLIKNKPDSICLYTFDGEIIACKKRISSYDLYRVLAIAPTINSGCYLADMHDDENFGIG